MASEEQQGLLVGAGGPPGGAFTGGPGAGSALGAAAALGGAAADEEAPPAEAAGLAADVAAEKLAGSRETWRQPTAAELVPAGTRSLRGAVPFLVLPLVAVLAVMSQTQWGQGRIQIRPVFENKAKAAWCNTSMEAPPAPLASPALAGPPLQVKVLTYNLQWWKLFGVQGGNNGSEGKLVAAAGRPQPFDFMGFQECDHTERVLSDAGLLGDYTRIQGGMSIGIVYNNRSWVSLADGEAWVAEDQPREYWGKRKVQWARLRHRQTGKVVFFANHHGPLPINTGGVCGGVATAHQLMHVIEKNSVPGDSVILVGDFNADDTSLTVHQLEKYLRKAFDGKSFGGIDHVFTNVPASHAGAVLGSGGSDHKAVSLVLDLAGAAPAPAWPAGARRRSDWPDGAKDVRTQVDSHMVTN